MVTWLYPWEGGVIVPAMNVEKLQSLDQSGTIRTSEQYLNQDSLLPEARFLTTSLNSKRWDVREAPTTWSQPGLFLKRRRLSLSGPRLSERWAGKHSWATSTLKAVLVHPLLYLPHVTDTNVCRTGNPSKKTPWPVSIFSACTACG